MTETIQTIVLNGDNIISNGYNNTLQYTFPGSSVNIKDSQIAISTIQITNSQFNINSQLYGNNTFQILIPYNNGTIDTQYTLNINLPNGYYGYSDINQYVQNKLILIGAYLISTGSGTPNVYFWQIEENASYYSSEVDQNVVPTSGSHTGYTLPSTGLWSGTGSQSLPTVGHTCQTVINSNFGLVIGQNGSSTSSYTFPTTPQTTNQVNLSTFTPEVNPVQSYLMRCSLINNPYMIPSDVFYSFSTGNTPFGSVIQNSPNEYAWNTIPDQSVSQFTLTITDQNFNPVQFQESNIVVLLLLKSRVK